MGNRMFSKMLGRVLNKLSVDPKFLLNVVSSMTYCQPILLDYPVKPNPRYGYGKPPHPKLYEIINKNRNTYKNILENFLSFKEYFLKIPAKSSNYALEPFWTNEWLPGLDSVSLYSMLSLKNPKRFIEIGSGNSTKFAKRAIVDHGLRTKITSIDPNPRAQIDLICDTIIRQPFEDVDLSLLNKLEAGDFLYVDSSHRCFTNSDVTVVFLEVLPKLRKGVFVQFHDISLPYDYSIRLAERYYSEQYLLAVYILSESNKFNIVLPNSFISEDLELNNILSSLWNEPMMKGVPGFGGSFWIQMN